MGVRGAPGTPFGGGAVRGERRAPGPGGVWLREGVSQARVGFPGAPRGAAGPRRGVVCKL